MDIPPAHRAAPDCLIEKTDRQAKEAGKHSCQGRMQTPARTAQVKNLKTLRDKYIADQSGGGGAAADIASALNMRLPLLNRIIERLFNEQGHSGLDGYYGQSCKQNI
jgi:hypothetical protein